MNVGDRVQIRTCDYPAANYYETPASRITTLTGTVQRVWGNRAVNVTVKTDDGRTFVRLLADVTKIGA